MENYDKNENGIYVPQDIVVPVGKVLTILQDARTGRVRKEMTDNMITTVGKESLADGFIGTTSNNKGIATYCAVGTSSVAPALGDIALGAEIFRKLIAVRSRSNNIASFQIFFTTAEAIGTLREAGLYGDDASATTNSGTLFARTAINRTKSSNDTLTILWTVAFG